MDEERKPPNFAPWDRGQFLGRLKTYRHVDKWTGKPERINEVQWAKRGWSCVGKEMVGCVGGCGKEVVIMLEDGRKERQDIDETQDTEKRPSDEEEDEDEWREKAQEQLVEKYAEMVVTSHESGCLWRRKGCDGMPHTSMTALANVLRNHVDTIQRLSLAHHKTAIDDLRQRYHSLVAIASELPPDPFPPPDMDLSSISQDLIPLLHQPSSEPPSTTPPNPPKSSANDTTNTTPPPPLSTSALALALLGWQAEANHVIGLATCTACFRRLGLWLFKPSLSPPSSSDSPENQPSMHRLDLVSEHRDYCPWVNAQAQNGSITTSTTNKSPQQRTSLEGGGLTGWQALLRAVNACLLHKRHTTDNVPKSAAATPTLASSKNTSNNNNNNNDHDGAAASEVASVAESSVTMATTMTREEGVLGGVDMKGRDERDRERWAKLKRLKQAFHVKRRVKDKGKSAAEGGKEG